MSKSEIDQELVDYVYSNFQNVPKGREYEKMILGLEYQGFDPDLTRTRIINHELALDYPKIRLSDFNMDMQKYSQARTDHLSRIFGCMDGSQFIEPPFYVDYGCNIKLGKNFYCNFNTTFLDCALIEFGDDVLVGPNVTFTTATHPTEPVPRKQGIELAYPIKVGNNVWFAAGCTILPGVTIADGAVIGAGAVVTKDVPKNAIVAGVPAKVLRIMEEGESAAEADASLKRQA